MNGGILPIFLICATLGLALSLVGRRDAWLGVAAIVVSALVVSMLMVAPGASNIVLAGLFLSTILKQPASPAWLVALQGRAAEAVRPAYEQLAAALPAQPVLHVDESPTKEGPAKGWVWTFVAATFTVFACRLSRAADVPKGLLGFRGALRLHRFRRGSA